MTGPPGTLASSPRAGDAGAEIESVQIRRLRCETNGTVTFEQSFWVATATITLPVPIPGEPEKRPLQYAVALAWDETLGSFQSLPTDVPTVLHLFLPTRQTTGLPFLIHGEFVTNLGRTSIGGDFECNRGLAEALAKLVAKTLLSAFGAWKGEVSKLRSLYEVAPLPMQSGDWLAGVSDAFKTLLEANESVVLTIDEGRLARPKECWLGSRLVHDLYRALPQNSRTAWKLMPLAFFELGGEGRARPDTSPRARGGDDGPPFDEVPLRPIS